VSEERFQTGEAIALAKAVSELRVRVDALTKLPDQVAKLAKSLSHALDEGEIPKAEAPVWLGLDDETRADQVAELGDWVEQVLRRQYPAYARVIASCWPDHPEALAELGNLRAEWRLIYERDHPWLDGALNWHDRWLPGVLHRLRLVMENCSAGECSARR